MIADCWRCGCSIELTADQQRHLESLLDGSTEDSTAIRQSNIPNARVDSSHPVTRPHLRAPQRAAPPARRADPVPVAMGLMAKGEVDTKRQLKRNWFQQMPAWLISLLFHLALLALLALLFFDRTVALEDLYITLSPEASRMRWEGGETEFTNPQDVVQFDMPIPVAKTPAQRAALVRAQQDAKQLQVDPAASRPELPSLQQVKQTLRVGTVASRTFAARDPRVRGEIVTREGGTTLSEAAVARGLRWMSRHQNPDGSWSLHRFHRSSSCRGRCGGRGSIDCDSAATSLCLLPFLGAGQTHQTGIYQKVVAQGLRWLLDHQRRNGDLRNGDETNAGMYAHGQGAIVLCEAFALTRDEQLREPAQRGIDFIVAAQHSFGGWRYRPGEVGDTSVLGWQLMALQSARSAGLEVPLETWELANLYLDAVQSNDGSRYAYQPNRQPTHVMTAEALLCRMYLGWNQDFAPLQEGVRYLSSEHLPKARKPNFYYWYYATQVMHHNGGKAWRRWNLAMRDLLVVTQVKKGHEAGSWDPASGHAHQGGRIYSTALAVCTLEVYYRHAPIFRQLELQ